MTDKFEKKVPHLEVVKEGRVLTPREIFDGATRRVQVVLIKKFQGQELTSEDNAELIRIQGELGNINEGNMDDRLKGDVKNLMDHARELEREFEMKKYSI